MYTPEEKRYFAGVATELGYSRDSLPHELRESRPLRATYIVSAKGKRKIAKATGLPFAEVSRRLEEPGGYEALLGVGGWREEATSARAFEGGA